MTVRRAIVVGGGISGLAAAHRLRELDASIDVELHEASPSLGGWLGTEERDGFVIELGADAILTEKKPALELVHRLGIQDRLVRTVESKRGAYVVSRGRLAKVPEGFSMMAPVDPWAFLRSETVGTAAKLRAGMEMAIPPRHAVGEESLARFVRRRFGPELLERLAQPLVSGIYGSDAETLSLEATMPRFPAMERDRGSVGRALREQRGTESANGARYGLFIAFDRGMRVLIDALAGALGERAKVRSAVESISRAGSKWRVQLSGSGSSRATAGHASRWDGAREADVVVLAVPGHRAASLLRAIDERVADGLDAIPHGSAATVTFAWRETEIAHPLDAYGFVVPAVERRSILASTWASAKWPGRAPQGWALIRAFVGGLHDPDAADRDDESLVAIARRELRALMGIDAEPLFARVVRYPRAMPIYRVGHLERARALEARLASIPGLALAGNSLRGVGIPDAIGSGERAAEDVLR